MKTFMKSDIPLYLSVLSKPHANEKHYRELVALTLFSLFGWGIFPAIGQTVTYNYDASGNVISKKVTKPLNTTDIRTVNDTVFSSNNMIANIWNKPTFTPTPVFKKAVKSIDEPNETEMKANTPFVAALSADSRSSSSISDIKKESNHN